MSAKMPEYPNVVFKAKLVKARAGIWAKGMVCGVRCSGSLWRKPALMAFRCVRGAWKGQGPDFAGQLGSSLGRTHVKCPGGEHLDALEMG